MPTRAKRLKPQTYRGRLGSLTSLQQ